MYALLTHRLADRPPACALSVAQFNPADAASLASKVTNPEGSAKFADKNYIVINSEPGVVLRGRKGTTGIIVAKSTQALVIGLYDNNDVQPGDASKVVEGIGEYLKSVVRVCPYATSHGQCTYWSLCDAHLSSHRRLKACVSFLSRRLDC